MSVEARWFEAGQPLAAEASMDVWVDYPVSEKENAIAAALLDDEVGKYVALGGNAVHLKRAVARISQAKKAEPTTPPSAGSRRSTSSPSSSRSDRKRREGGSEMRYRGRGRPGRLPGRRRAMIESAFAAPTVCGPSGHKPTVTAGFRLQPARRMA